MLGGKNTPFYFFESDAGLFFHCVCALMRCQMACGVRRLLKPKLWRLFLPVALGGHLLKASSPEGVLLHSMDTA